MTILRAERTYLKDFLIQSLVQCGWDDKLRLMCREEITKANGLISGETFIIANFVIEIKNCSFKSSRQPC